MRDWSSWKSFVFCLFKDKKWILKYLDAWSVQDRPVVLADVDVGALVLVQLDHVLVELELQVLVVIVLEESREKVNLA